MFLESKSEMVYSKLLLNKQPCTRQSHGRMSSIDCLTQESFIMVEIHKLLILPY
jgi:hypothetical protein